MTDQAEVVSQKGLAQMALDMHDRENWLALIGALGILYPRIGGLSDAFKPGYSHCHRCKTNWGFVRGHNTQFSETEGCFPLCEECWQELENPEKRLPFYEQMWQEWVNMSGADDTPSWTVIREAVLRERSER